MRHRLLLLLITAITLPVGSAAAQSIDTMAIRAHTRFLADDRLAGRGTGSEGERIAAAYIESQLRRLGLEPVRHGSYSAPIPLRAATIDAGTRLRLIQRRDTLHFEHGADFLVNTGGRGAFRDFGGPGVFFGQPIHAAPLVAAAPSLQGRVAVFLGPLGGAATELVPALSRAGVDGVLLLVTDPAQFDLYVRSRGGTRFYVDAPVDDPVWQPSLPVLIAGPRLAQALLDGAQVPEALIQGTATGPLELPHTIAATLRTTTYDVPAANIGGILRGSDSRLRDEFVVYTAHYDHLGVSAADADGDSIYNGFSDNAAGVAMLLAIAEALRDAPPARSVAFLFFTGEERGLLGSSFMASQPPIPLERITTLINLDAGAPPAPPISWRIAGGDSRPGELATAIAEQRGWTVTLGAASPNSDYWPFLRRGVPAIFIIPGDRWENTTAAERDALRRRWDRYHRADDHWHPDFPFAGLQRYAEFALLVGVAAAR